MEHVEGKFQRLLLLLDALHIALSSGLSVFKAKYSTCESGQVDTGVYTCTTHKKCIYPHSHTLITREHGMGNLLAIFLPYFLEYQLVFTFPASEAGYLASLTLEPSFLRTISTL